MKKILSILLSLLILSGVLPFCAAAVPQECAAPLMAQEFSNDSGPVFDFLNSRVNIQEFRSYLLEKFAQCTAEIDLSKYNLIFSETNQNTIARYIWKEMPEAFHVDTLQFYYWTNSLQISKIVVTYYNTPQQYQTMLSASKAAADQMLEGVIGNSALSDAEKALIIHDRLVLHCTYNKGASNRYDMYGALVNGSAVCEGYTKAYSYMLDKLGIKNYFCDSDDLVHAWNIVYIGGLSYHIDVTWDDPDLDGWVNHDNFLRSTQGIKETGHTYYGTTDYDTSPFSTKYDSYYWQNSNTEFQLIGSELYYVDNVNEELCRVVGDSGKEVLCSVSDTWRVDAQYVWTSNYTLLSSACNSLLVSQADGIYAYHLSDHSVTKAFTPSVSGKYLSVFEFSYRNGKIVCEMRNNPDPNEAAAGAATLSTTYRPLAKDHVYDSSSDVLCNICGSVKEGVTSLKGDLNGDWTVNSSDAIYLLYHALFGTDRYPVTQKCDYDKNGSVTSSDAIYLLYHALFGEERYPIA